MRCPESQILATGPPPFLPVGSEVAGEEPGGKAYKDPQRICDFTMTQR